MADYPSKVVNDTYQGTYRPAIQQTLNAGSATAPPSVTGVRTLTPWAKKNTAAANIGGGGNGPAPAPRRTQGQLWPRA